MSTILPDIAALLMLAIPLQFLKLKKRGLLLVLSAIIDCSVELCDRERTDGKAGECMVRVEVAVDKGRVDDAKERNEDV